MSVSKKKIYFWNMAGSLCNAFASILYLAMVTRTLDDKTGDIFSIGFAFSQLMLTVGTFQVRVFQSTDVRDGFDFIDYFVFRITTCFLMILASVLYLILKGYGIEKFIIMLLLCVYKMNAALSDVFEGLFQKNERLDIAGKLLSYNTILCMIGFMITLLITKSLTYGCIVLVIISFAVVFIYGYSNSKKFERLNFSGYSIKKYMDSCKELFVKCLPVFINGFLILYIFNIPKNSIDSAIEMNSLPDGFQVIYGIMFMPANAINLLFIFFRPQITQMAFQFADKSYEKMIGTIKRIFVYLTAFTIFVCVSGYFLGPPVLGIIYGKDIGAFKLQLFVLLFAGGLSTIATLFDNVLTIMRKQIYSTLSYAISIISVIFISDSLVLNHKMTGAVVVFGISMIALLISEFFVFVLNFKREKKANFQ